MFRLVSVLVILAYLNNFVQCHYLDKPVRNQIFKTSLKDSQNGYMRLRVPLHAVDIGKALETDIRNFNNSCKDAGFTCDAPFDESTTRVFECKNDKQCPGSYKCCDQKCFQHKICVESTDLSADGNTCVKWPYECSYPYPLAFSRKYRCTHDRQCPLNFKCCWQKCFSHKICSKRSESSRKLPLPMDEVGAITTASPPMNTEKKKSSTVNPEYEEYYYHYGNNEEDEGFEDYYDDES